jgi:hypothetical protein
MLAALGAASAGATCTDSLSLASFVRTDKHYRLTSSGLVDSTVKSTTYNGTGDLIQAVPVPVPVDFNSYRDSLLLPIRFAANCGSDSVSQVKLWRSVDSAGKDKLQADVRVTAGAEVVKSMKAMAAGGLTFGITGGTLSFSSYWPIADATGKDTLYYFGVLKGGAGVIGALAQARSVAYKNGDVKNMSSFPISSVLPGPAGLAAEQSIEVSQLQGNWKALLDAGTYDSVAIDFRSLDLKYDFASVGIAAHSGAAGAGVRTVANGWMMSSDVAGAGVVRSLDGRVLRQFPSGKSFQWDGRNAQGQPVAHGIYLVGFEGLDVRRVVVP